MDRVSEFISACRGGDVEAVSGMVCEDGTLADCRAPDEMPAIICATCSHQFEIVQLLLDNGADTLAVDHFGTPADWARRFKRGHIADLIDSRHGDC